MPMHKAGLDEDAGRNIQFYTDLVERHGIDPRSLNWGSRASQERRFSVLSEIGLRSGESVLDVGCGLGDFHGWLRQSGIEVDYRGVDLTPKMIEVARSRFPEVSFDVADVLEADLAPADYVVASGIFYLRKHEPFEFMKTMLARLFALCRKGVAVNTLSAWADRQEAGEFFADPLRTVEFCRTLTPWVVLRHDYHPADFTVALFREARRP